MGAILADTTRCGSDSPIERRLSGRTLLSSKTAQRCATGRTDALPRSVLDGTMNMRARVQLVTIDM
jgi:hypothetical protein